MRLLIIKFVLILILTLISDIAVVSYLLELNRDLDRAAILGMILPYLPFLVNHWWTNDRRSWVRLLYTIAMSLAGGIATLIAAR